MECTFWTLTKRMEKKVDGNYTRMLRAILNKSRDNSPQNSRYTMNQARGTQLEKKGQTHKRHTLVDPFVQKSIGKTTRSNLYKSSQLNTSREQWTIETGGERVREIRASSVGRWWWWWWLTGISWCDCYMMKYFVLNKLTCFIKL